MFFERIVVEGEKTITIDGNVYVVSSAANVDVFNCKMHLVNSVFTPLSPDGVDNVSADNYVSWRKELVANLKKWDQIYCKH